MRLFVGVWPSPELTQELENWLEARRSEFPEGIAWVRPEKLHLTLAFLGNVQSDRLDHLKSALEDVAFPHSIELQLGGLGCFPDSRRPRVLWSGLRGDIEALSRLQDAVRKACDFYFERRELRPFSPHLTLARVKTASPATAKKINVLLESSSDRYFGRWTVSRFDLIHSLLGRDASYKWLSSYLLARSG